MAFRVNNAQNLHFEIKLVGPYKGLQNRTTVNSSKKISRYATTTLYCAMSNCKLIHVVHVNAGVSKTEVSNNEINVTGTLCTE